MKRNILLSPKSVHTERKKEKRKKKKRDNGIKVK